MATVLQNKNYVMSVWITGILIAPILMILILAFKTNVEWSAGFIGFYILAIFVEVLFSLPAIFLHRLAFRELATDFKSQILLKTVLIIISFLCLGFTFLIVKLAVDIQLDYETAVPFLCFATSVGMSHFIFSAKTKTALPITGAL
jgi:hypothetical protein